MCRAVMFGEWRNGKKKIAIFRNKERLPPQKAVPFAEGGVLVLLLSKGEGAEAGVCAVWRPYVSSTLLFPTFCHRGGQK